MFELSAGQKHSTILCLLDTDAKIIPSTMSVYFIEYLFLKTLQQLATYYSSELSIF